MQKTKSLYRFWHVFALFALTAAPTLALDGMLGIHDPLSVIVCGGRYYVFGTGRGIPFPTPSDGFTWKCGGRVFDQVPDSVFSTPGIITCWSITGVAARA